MENKQEVKASIEPSIPLDSWVLEDISINPYPVTEVFNSATKRWYVLWSGLLLKPGMKSEKNLRTAARCCGSLETYAASRNKEGRTVVTWNQHNYREAADSDVNWWSNRNRFEGTHTKDNPNARRDVRENTMHFVTRPNYEEDHKWKVYEEFRYKSQEYQCYKSRGRVGNTNKESLHIKTHMDLADYKGISLSGSVSFIVASREA